VLELQHNWQDQRFPLKMFEVVMEIPQTDWIWPSVVGFTDAPIPHPCLLGLTGFFEFFDATFASSSLTLRPNQTFKQVVNVTA
jgi:hypothetical protein